MNKYLVNLARLVLSFYQSNGVTKVRFAKILYFLHKKAVQEKFADVNSLQFIRMPLGPVPVDFDQLDKDKYITTIKIPTTLAYNKQLYLLKNTFVINESQYTYFVEQNLIQLNQFSTSELVELSHQEPSWIRKGNGDRYYLAPDDFYTSLPKSKSLKLTSEEDEQILQSKLIDGMLDDIVKESTRLEYPNS